MNMQKTTGKTMDGKVTGGTLSKESTGKAFQSSERMCCVYYAFQHVVQ